MFKEWKYRRETREFFNPEKYDAVSREDFLNILSGRIQNPLKLRDIRSGEYVFMIVGVQQNTSLDYWAGGKWGVNGYSTAHENSSWYMRVSSDGKSKIAIPSKKLVLGINPFESSDFKRVFPHRTSVAPYLLGDEMNIKKDSGNRTLLSGMSVCDLSDCLNELYPSPSPFGLLNS